MAIKIAIIDTGTGNLRSVYNALYKLNTNPVIANAPKQVLEAEKLILPGVGHFEKAMNNLKSMDLYDTLNEAVLVKKMPILGICLGMQLMARSSEEGKTAGFGWVDNTVIKFKIQNRLKYKVPQAGWNTVTINNSDSLFKKINNRSEFYFLHSYHYETEDATHLLGTTEYEYSFVSAIEMENIFGTQFHPEKSHDAGMQLLHNFISL
jgi:imidazole glycerol-phosphate synthase subunit HisH